MKSIIKKKMCNRDFPGGQMVKTSHSSAGGLSSIPGQGAKILNALRPKRNKEHKAEAIS